MLEIQTWHIHRMKHWSVWVGVLTAALPTAASASEFVGLSVRSIFGDHAFGAGGERIELPADFSDHQVQLYGAWALDDAWGVVLSLTPIGVATYDTTVSSYFGGGALGLEHRVRLGGFTLGLGAEAGGRPDADLLFEGQVAGTSVEMRPVVGTAMGGAWVSGSRAWSWGWAALSGGARVFSHRDLEPVVHGMAQFGLHLGPSIDLDLHVPYWIALGSVATVNGFGAGQTRYLGLGLGAIWWLGGQVGATASVDIGPYARANAVSPSLRLGLAWR